MECGYTVKPMPLMPLAVEWNRGLRKIPRVNGETYKYMRFGTELRHNEGVPKFKCTADSDEYAFFQSRYFVPEIMETFPMDVLENGRFHTYYVQSFFYDGNPVCQLYFILIDTAKKCMYESFVIGRARDDICIDVGPDKAVQLSYKKGEECIRLGSDVYATKLAAALQCVRLASHVGPA